MKTMVILEMMMLVGILALGVYATISDYLYGVIKNKVVLGFIIYAVILNAVYFGFFVSDIIGDYALNNAIVWCIILALFFTNTWAGGDCKMSIAVALLYPARYYFTIYGQITTLFMFIIFAFIIGYFYLAVDAVFCLLSNKTTLTRKYMRNSLTQFFFSYLTALIYITAITLLLQVVIPEGASLNTVLMFAVYMCIAWLVSSIKAFRNKYILGGLLIIDVVLCFVLKVIPFSLDYRIYLIIALLYLLQIIIQLRNYRTIPASEIQPRMILSTGSSIVLMQAKLDCIQKLSKESLGDRLTDEQAETIRKWGNHNNITLYVVKKVPFAGFILLGTIAYFIIWSATK